MYQLGRNLIKCRNKSFLPILNLPYIFQRIKEKTNFEIIFHDNLYATYKNIGANKYDRWMYGVFRDELNDIDLRTYYDVISDPADTIFLTKEDVL